MRCFSRSRKELESETFVEEDFLHRRFRKKKMFSEIRPQSQGSQNSLRASKVGSVKQNGGL